MAETKYSEKDLVTARDRFYPDWWLHEATTRMADTPHYLVRCGTREEQALALASKPEYLSVRLILR